MGEGKGQRRMITREEDSRFKHNRLSTITDCRPLSLHKCTCT